MASHRADVRPSARRRPDPSSDAGRQAPDTRGRHAHRAARRTTPGRLPGPPTVVGVVALAAAAVGTLGMGASAASPHHVATLSAVHGPGARSGESDTVSTAALRDRERAVSRDSQRDALKDATDADLEQATEEQAQERNAALAKLAASAEVQAGKIAKDAWGLPVTHGVYHLTARFGSCSGLWSHCHTGLDFASPTGTPIHAVANGTITETGSAGAYGNRTVETLPDGTELWYCHQSAFEVQKGDKVLSGQEIGRVGSTGNTTGPHVHLEVRPGAGDPVDPYQALVAHGLKP